MNLLYITHVDGLYGANSSMLDMMKQLTLQNRIYVIAPVNGTLTKKLRELRITYKVISMNPSTHEENIGISEKWFRAFGTVDTVKAVMQCIKKWNIDIVHSNSSVTDVGALAALFTHTKHVWHIRELPVQYRFSYDFPLVHKLLVSRSDKMICISRYVRDELHMTGKNVTVIYNPIDIEKYAITRNTYFANKDIHILVCGLLYRNKRQMDVVKAVEILVKRGHNKIHLRIVGGGDANYGNQLKNYIKRHDLETCVSMIGFCEDLSEHRKWADIAVMSSVYEALGRVTIESMLSELLVIGTDCGGTAELIREGYNGLKYNPDRVAELADKIEYAVNHREECIKMIKNAKKYAVEQFDSQKQAVKIQRIYEEMVSKLNGGIIL